MREVGILVRTFVRVDAIHGVFFVYRNERALTSCRMVQTTQLKSDIRWSSLRSKQPRDFRTGARPSAIYDDTVLRRNETSLGFRRSDEWISRQLRPSRMVRLW
jgi:hypothetical protein